MRFNLDDKVQGRGCQLKPTEARLRLWSSTYVKSYPFLSFILKLQGADLNMDTNMNIDVENWMKKTKISKQMISYVPNVQELRKISFSRFNCLSIEIYWWILTRLTWRMIIMMLSDSWYDVIMLKLTSVTYRETDWLSDYNPLILNS